MPPPRRLNRVVGLPGGRKKRPAAATTQAKCCSAPKIEDRDGAKICTECFTQISEANIVADVTFEENANGSATVQGGFLGENARHVSSLNSTAFRKMGGGERNNIEEIERRGRDQLSVFRGRNLLNENVFGQALQIWGIAARNNFTAGRSLEEVVASCAYAALRRQPDNTVLLIDLAEVIKVNVFRLGDVYKTMCHTLYLRNETVGYQHMVDVESLIMKYCDKLEFYDDTRQVAEDALKIVRRMKRDWMVTGRHPAGLCGACIILAARMNNFKRTVREVVYVAKIADATISKRIEEFRQTKSAALTVSQFRKYATRLKHQHDPPAMLEGQQRLAKLEKKKRKRQAALDEAGILSLDGTINIDDQSDIESAAGTPAPEPDSQEEERRKRARLASDQPEAAGQEAPRFDSDGFAIPALPARSIPLDPAIVPMVPDLHAPKKRGRPKKSAAPAPVEISESELLLEEELQEQIQEALVDDEVNQQREQLLAEKEHAKSEETAKAAKELETQNTEARRAAAGIVWHSAWNAEYFNKDMTKVTAETLEEEFRDDAEVENCILSDQQAREKEKIWLYHNEDWLRDQYEKELAKKIAASAPAKQKKTRGGKKKSKKGQEFTNDGTPAQTPADAAAAMLADKAGPQFSKYVNYEQLGKIYNHDKSRASSRAGSEAPSVSQADSESRIGTPAPASRAATPIEAPPTPTASQPQAQAAGRKPTASPAPPPTPDATQTVAGAEQEVPDDEDEVEEEAVEYEGDDAYSGRFRYPGGDDDGEGDEFGGGDDYAGGYDDDDDYEAALNPTHGASLEGTF